MIPLRWLAGSTRRLIVAALVCFGALFASAFPIAAYIRQSSDSLVLDTVIQTSWLLALLAGSGFTAILVGDRIFPYRWRERVILGLPVAPVDPDADDPPPLLQSHIFGFSVLFVAALALGALALNALTSDFLGEYQRVGYMHTLRRSDKTELKLELIGELGEARREQKVRDALDVLNLMWRDGRQPPEVQRAAVVALGRQAYALRSSVGAWSREGLRAHWELDLLRDLRRRDAPDLRAAFAAGSSTELRAAVALALGKLADADSVEVLGAAATGPEPRGLVWRAAVLGLGIAREPTLLPDLVPLAARVEDAEDFRALAWSVGELSRHYVPETDRAIDAFFPELVATFLPLTRGGTLDRRCEATDVLRKTGDARIWRALTETFATPDAEGVCPTAYVDIDEQGPELMVATEPLRMRIIRALALVALGNQELLDWLRSRQHDERLTEFIRQKATEAVQLIEAKQD